MKKLILLIIVTTLIHFNLFAQQNKSVLFLGNSYTAFNNLPYLVSRLALSTNDTLTYDSNTPGGHRLMGHASNSTSLSKIKARAWDYVALQAQSQEPSWAAWQVEQEVFPFAKILCDSIRANNACSEPLFYMTWGRKNGDANNCSGLPVVCTYEGMDSMLNVNYREMGIRNRAAVSPVGAVWHYLRDNSSINLYNADESHPSQAGSYAAALTFYTLIFEKNPSLTTYNYNFTQAVADTIRQAVSTVVYNVLTDWNNDQYYISSTTLSGCDSVYYNGTYFTQSIFYDDTLVGANVFGCDSIVRAIIAVSESSNTIIDTTITQGDSILINGTYYSTESTVIDSQYTTVGCDSFSTYYVKIDTTPSTGVFITQTVDLTIYPNPTTNFVHIDNPSNQTFSWSLTNITGKQIKGNTDYLRTDLIDISMLSDGMYILSLDFENGESISKMIVKH